MKFRAAVATAAAVPLALGLAACGGEPKATGYKPSTPATTTAAPKADATNTAAAAKPVAHLNRVTFVPAMNAALTKQKTWRIAGTVTGNGTTLATISGVQSAKPPAVSIEMSGLAFNGRTIRMIGTGKAAYLSWPGKTPAGKYVKVTAAELADPKNGLGNTLNSADPTNVFKQIAKAMRNVKYVRSQTVDGLKLDQYDLVMDTATALKAVGTKTIPAQLPRTLTYSLWMDSAHVVRRMTFDQLGVSMVMTMSDYNKPVTITAPPASKIVR
ncbi:hypothetical protein [Kribbella sp. NPDC003557]|uniref:hypothetical protein n=1 Tax=Kribbella sp. NPDC003557 TaxID=3154449 RepID=UPI0033B8EDA0